MRLTSTWVKCQCVLPIRKKTNENEWQTNRWDNTLTHIKRTCSTIKEVVCSVLQVKTCMNGHDTWWSRHYYSRRHVHQPQLYSGDRERKNDERMRKRRVFKNKTNKWRIKIIQNLIGLQLLCYVRFKIITTMKPLFRNRLINILSASNRKI